MYSLRKNILQLVFSGSYMLRWNDKLRPASLWEIDKQGHKMLVAFILWQEQAQHLSHAQAVTLGHNIVEGGLFDYLYRMIITDLKPPVFYRIKKNPDHYHQLTDYVLKRLEPSVTPLSQEFWQRMRAYFSAEQPADPLAHHILNAAHLYASQWEFKIIEPHNNFDDEIPEIKQTFEKQLRNHTDLAGMSQILDPKSALGKMANLCGQLRFQIRWSQAPRIPATSVLGHMFLVATYAYFSSLVIDACPARRINNFFCGLMHDLPELLTRDIISPVKRSIAKLPELIKEYEEQELERRFFAALQSEGYRALVEKLRYYLGLDIGSEFDQCIRNADGSYTKIDTFTTLHIQYNDDKFDPKDGRLIKDCDLLAAFMEAHSSIRNGVASPHLQEALARLRSELVQSSVPQLRLESLLSDFD